VVARQDSIKWSAHAHIDKFSGEQVEACRRALNLDRDPTGDELLGYCFPEAFTDIPGNLLTTAGLDRITSRIFAGTDQAITSTSVRIGVGNGTTAAAIGDTDLGAASGSGNRQFKTMDATYPTRSNGVMTFRATFGTTVANFAWNEWGIDIENSPPASDGTTVNDVLLNHKVVGMGTKVNTATWVFTVTITLS
jgi:hypothetical protein